MHDGVALSQGSIPVRGATSLVLINGFRIQNPAEFCTESNDTALVGSGPTASAIAVLASVLIKEGARDAA